MPWRAKVFSGIEDSEIMPVIIHLKNKKILETGMMNGIRIQNEMACKILVKFRVKNE